MSLSAFDTEIAALKGRMAQECRFSTAGLGGLGLTVRATTLDRLFTELEDLRSTVKQGEAVVSDLLKSTGGKIICQDYGRMNDFLVTASKVQSP